MAISLCISGYSHVFFYKIFHLPDYKVSLVLTLILSSSLNPKFSICFWKTSVFVLRRKIIKKIKIHLFSNCIGFCRCTFRLSLLKVVKMELAINVVHISVQRFSIFRLDVFLVRFWWVSIWARFVLSCKLYYNRLVNHRVFWQLNMWHIIGYLFIHLSMLQHRL